MCQSRSHAFLQIEMDTLALHVSWCLKDHCLSSVATSLLALRWMCDSPRTGCSPRITPIYIYIPIEWSWWVTSNNACESGEQLIVLPDGNDESDLVRWSLLLLAATVWRFEHLPLKLSGHSISNISFDFYYRIIIKMRARDADSLVVQGIFGSKLHLLQPTSVTCLTSS